MAPKITIVYGGATLPMHTPEEQKEVLDILKQHNVKEIDTARIYPGSEQTLGALEVPKSFIIDTKAAAFKPRALSKESVLESAKESLGELGVDSVEIYYLHSPDPDTPISETLEAIQELYKAGKFKSFGLSNFTPAEVQEVYDIASSKGYVLPTVFQGNYNPIARHYDSTLFPLLRKLGIRFYAYSPLAGGFLVKTPEFLSSGGAGRWEKGNPIADLYHRLYNKPELVAALKSWGEVAEEAGVTKAALAYRWTAYNSALKGEEGDAVIVGATKITQLKETLEAIEQGPLEEKIVKKIDAIWEGIKDVAPVDNYHG